MRLETLVDDVLQAEAEHRRALALESEAEQKLDELYERGGLDEEDLWVRSGMNIADHRTCRTAERKRQKIRSLRLAMLASPRNEAERAKKYWLSKAMANE